jgi:hypothetical protein
MTYFGVMPRTEKDMPFKLFSRKEHAEHWLKTHNMFNWHVVKFDRRVPDYISLKSKKRIDKLF